MMLVLIAALSIQAASPSLSSGSVPLLAGEAATDQIEREFLASEAQRGETDGVQASLDCTRAMTTPEINACGALDLDRETARMERYLETARQRAVDMDAASTGHDATHQTAYLSSTQAAWTAYAEIACAGVYDQWKGGTIRTVMGLGCRIAMTRERTRVVWRDYLTYADSTPPILPEPVGPAEREER